MRVLMITHEASLTGAPRVALLAARTLRDQGHSVRVLSRRPGPVEDDFRSVGPCAVEPLYRVRRRLWTIRSLRGLAWALDTLLATLSIARARPDLVYLNSTASLMYLRPALWLRRRVILHSHESASVATQFIEPARVAGLLRRARLVGCSPSARHDLAGLAGVPEHDVDLVLSVPDSARVLELAAVGTSAFTPLPGELVIGCCGSVEHRKGADLWLEVERIVRAALPGRALRFVWIGSVDPAFEGLAPESFIGPAGNPYGSMGRFDVATLPSRDDPFPLVVMESMLLGKPVVAFDVGGVAQQVGDGGIVVPAGDTAEFARALVELIEDPDRRAELGRRAQERAGREYSSSSFVEALTRAVAPEPNRSTITRFEDSEQGVTR